MKEHEQTIAQVAQAFKNLGSSNEQARIMAEQLVKRADQLAKENNSSFIEDFYSKYLTDPENLPDGWKSFFDGLRDNEETISKNLRGPSWAPAKIVDNLFKEKERNETNENSAKILSKKTPLEGSEAKV